LERVAVIAGRRGERVEARGAVAGGPEGDSRALLQDGRLLPRGARVRKRLAVVMRDELDEVVRADLLDPFTRELVLLRADGARHLGVRDVPDEHVPERVLALSGDGGPGLGPDELTALELEQAPLDLVGVAAAETAKRARPEALADDGGVLEGCLRLRR